MNCNQTQEKIHNYLEDLLPEPERAEVRRHVRDCEPCMSCVLMQGSFAADLKRLNYVRPAFDMTQLVTEAAVLNQRGFRLKRAGDTLGIKVGITTVVIRLMAMGIYIYGPEAVQRIRFQSPSENKPLPVESESEAELYIQQLKVIEQGLTEALKTSKVNKIHPLNARLWFATAVERQSFLKDVQAQGWEIKFQNQEAIAFQMTRPELQSLVALIQEKKIPAENIFENAESVPKFKKTVSVDLVLRLPSNAPEEQAARYGSLRFLFPNSQSVRQQLESDGFQFLYTSPRLWVWEVSAEDYAHLRERIRVNGSVIFSEDSEGVPNQTGMSKLRVIVSLEGKWWTVLKRDASS